MTEKPKLPTGQVVNWDESQMQTVYSNIMGFGLTAFDVSLTFGVIRSASIEEVDAKANIKILLTPEQASNLMGLLRIALNSYVENNGPLRTSGAIDENSVNERLAQSLIKK